MNVAKITDSIKQSYHRFCDGTSIHGFTELYYAKTVFWKLVWLALIGGALGVTVYQVSRAVDQYMHQSASTLIQQATEDQLTYPPLKFCVAHWLHWVDWKRAFSLNFTKDAILYGMTYLTNVYSSDTFNETDAQAGFNESMALNKFSTIERFYNAIAKRTILSGPIKFNERDFVITDLDNIYFCYKANSTEILSYFRKEQSQVTTNRQLSLSLSSKFDIKNYVTPEEYNSYMAEWIYRRTIEYYLNEGSFTNYAEVQNNYSKVQPPNILFVDGYSTMDINLMPEIDKYFITIKASGQLLKNKGGKICFDGVKSFASDTSCSQKCRLKAADYCGYYASTFLYALQVGNVTYLNNTIRNNGIIFLNDTFGMTTSTSSSKTRTPISTDTFPLTSAKDNLEIVSSIITTTPEYEPPPCNYSLAYNSCLADNCSVVGCEKWTYDVTVTTRSLYNSLHDVAYKSQTSIYINYPVSADVLIMAEVDSKSWEDFIGNVGGLLGIWTGASIISVFQLVYLCCFADMQNFSIFSCLNKNRGNRFPDINATLKSGHKITSNDVHQIVRRKKHLKHDVKANTLFT